MTGCPLFLALALVAGGNLLAWAESRLGSSPPVSALVALPVITALLWYCRRVQSLTWGELGWGWAGSLRAWRTGTMVGLAIATPAVLGLAFPPLLDAPVSYRPVDDAPFAALLLRAGITMPLGTVLVEEVAFRGVLLAALARRYPRVQAALLSSAAFMLWHPTVIWLTLAETNLFERPVFLMLGGLLAHLVVFAAGLVFCWLVWSTGRLVAAVAAHWVANAAILAVLWLR